MTLPAKLQSYVACGTPILAVAGGESRRIVVENGCGCSCGWNSTEIAEALLKMKNNGSALADMRDRALLCYQNNIHPKVLIDFLEMLFLEAFERQR